MTVSTFWRSASRAATSCAATSSSPLTTSTRGSPLTIVLASARSFWLNVSRAASTTTRNRRNPGSAGVNVNDSRFGPASSVTGSDFASSPLTNRRAVAGWATVEVMSAVTWTDSPRRAVDGAPQPLDEHLVAAAEAHQPRLDLDAAGRRERRLALPRARRVVAVREQHDPLLRVVREQRRGEAERGADVGRRCHRGGRDAVDLRELRREPLHEGVAAERDDPRNVLVLLGLERLADVGERLLAALGADGVREVHDEHDREPVDRQHELEAGKGEHERGQQPDPQRERHAPPVRRQAAAANRRGAARRGR